MSLCSMDWRYTNHFLVPLTQKQKQICKELITHFQWLFLTQILRYRQFQVQHAQNREKAVIDQVCAEIELINLQLYFAHCLCGRKSQAPLLLFHGLSTPTTMTATIIRRMMMAMHIHFLEFLCSDFAFCRAVFPDCTWSTAAETWNLDSQAMRKENINIG